LSNLADSAKEGKLDVPLGASTLAIIEVAMSRGFEIAALVLTRASPSRESYKTVIVANTAADAQVTASFSEELQAHGFPQSSPDWCRQ
jgi:hypothetical protein